MRAGLYARCSTYDKGQDVDLQLVPLREYCQHRDFTIAGEFVDNGVSGIKDHRPQLDRLMNAAKKRQIDCILVWKLDRFGRSLKHLVTALDELSSLGVAFISLRDNLDLTTPQGRLMFHIIGAMAEFERELIGERVRAGMQNAKAKGRKLGRRSLIDERLLKTVAHMRGHGYSLQEIANNQKVSKSLVHKCSKISRLQPTENIRSEIGKMTVHEGDVL
jgi:DNA invertase Pin-like site-specific DNA recombinase